LLSDVDKVSPKTGKRVTAGKNTYSRGIVVTPLPWLGVFYNESTNFRPSNADQLNIFGANMPNESGDGKDYGIKLYLMEGKLTGSFGWFETTFLNQSTRGPRVGPVGQFDTPRVAARTAIELYYQGLGTPQLADIWNQRGYLNNDDYFDTQDFASEGWEFSVTANPKPNWRITANISKQRNVSSNVAPAMKAWAVDIRTKLTDPKLLGLTTTLVKPDGVSFYTVADTLNLIDQRIVEISSLEGFADQRQPELSANVVTAYDFTEGRLKNFGVGGSYRWRDRATVGYGQLAGAAGALDPSKPFKNEATSWYGVFFNYRTTLFEKVQLRLQLNIDNLFDQDSPNVLLSREVNGARVDNRWTLPEGRSFALSANFQF
jgi:outer membrane receptor for ferric coprogen and ferric-rhodotorulic acid